MTSLWRVEMLGPLRATNGEWSVERFESKQTGGLLAYLAAEPETSHERSDLACLFWPDVNQEVSRSRLRQALASLRRQLETPGTPRGSLLISVGSAIRANPTHIQT